MAIEILLIRKACASKGTFIWNDEMQREWEITRKMMLEQIQLTPFDPEKTLRLVIDASIEGVGFVLFQWRDEWDASKGALIINANCTRFKESQLRFSPLEADAVSLDFEISACN